MGTLNALGPQKNGARAEVSAVVTKNDQSPTHGPTQLRKLFLNYS